MLMQILVPVLKLELIRNINHYMVYFLKFSEWFLRINVTQLNQTTGPLVKSEPVIKEENKVWL